MLKHCYSLNPRSPRRGGGGGGGGSEPPNLQRFLAGHSLTKKDIENFLLIVKGLPTDVQISTKLRIVPIRVWQGDLFRDI